MKINRSLVAGVWALVLLATSQPGSAQSTGSKVELGAQVTSLTLFNEFGDVTEPAFGGRFTFNFNRNVAVEAEGNFFPNKNVFLGLGEGRAVQGQFGVKVGKRFKKFGVFAKARPGFLSVGEVFFNEPGATVVIFGTTLFNARIGRKTHFTTDLGGVLEFYPSNRTIVRFDAGDTIVRYGRHFEYDPFNFPQLIQLPAKVKHNFQFTAGVGFRLGDSERDQQIVNPDDSLKRSSRYEAGVHFTSLSANPPRQICSDLCVFPDDPGPVTEPGIGGRFTFNVTDEVALEAETNFFTRKHYSFFGPGGYIFQSQFGIKAGRRFERFGIFGKSRPGFVGFTKTSQLVSTRTEILPAFGNRQVEIGEFRIGTAKYFSLDIGGVVEFYVSRRVMTRMDLGDTIIRYGEFAIPGFSLSNLIVRRPPETKHNFQFTGGIGFRF